MREKPQKVLYYRTEAVLNGKVPQTMNSRHMNYTYDRGKRLENSKLKDGGNYTCDRERNQEELMCSELAMKYPNQVLSAPRCTGQQLSKLWNREDHIEIRFHKEGADEMKTMEKSDRKMVDAISIKLEDKLPIISNLLKDNVGDINKKGRKEFRDKENKSRKEKMMADQKEAPALPVNTEKLILPLKTENHKKAHKLPVRTQNRKKSTEIEQREKCDAVKGDKDLWDIMNLEKQKKIRDNKNKETSVKEIIRREEEAVENEDFSEKRDLDKQNQSGIEHHGDFGDLVGQHNMDGFISLQSMQSSNISDFQIQKNERIEVTLTSDQDNRIQVPETLGSHDEESEKEKLCKDEKEEECVLDGHEKRDDKEVFQDMTIWTRKLQDNIHKAGEEYEKLQNFFKRISQLYRKFECCKTSLPEIFLKGFNVDGFKNRRIPGRHTMSKQEKDVNRKWRKNDMHHHDNNVEYKDRLTMLGRELHTYLQEKEHYVRYWNPVHGLSGYGNSRHWNPCHGLSRSHSNGDISRHIPGESKGESNQSPCDSDNSEGYRGRKKWSDGMSEKENRNYEDEKDRDEQEDPPYNDEIVSRTKTGHGKQLFREEATQPNYRYRKKHGQLEGGDFQLSDNLGLLLTIDKDIPPDLRKFIIDINPCLITCLKRHTSDSDLDPCSICLCLISLIQHFGSCPSDLSPMTNFCCLCVQLFRLVQQHVLICMENTGEMDCPLLMCRKISFLIEKDSRMIHTKEQKIWKKLKKYMSGFTGNKRSMETEKFDEEFFSLSSLTSINPLLIPSVGMSNPNTQTKSHRPSTTYMPSLQIIPEDSSDRSLNIQRDVPLTPERGSRSEPIVRKAEDGTVQVISKIIRSPRTRMTRPDRLIVSQFGTVSSLIGHPDTPTVTGPPTISPKTPKKVSFSESPHRAKSDIVADAFPETLQQEEADTDLQLSSIPSEPTSFEKVYGERLKSLPVEGHRRPIQDQILSLKEKPTGIPGIGEVVYGIREVLLEVVKYWGDLKMEYKEFGRLIQNSVKEEGVIFPDCKEHTNEVTSLDSYHGSVHWTSRIHEIKKLMIMRHRYQKNFQWVRLTHLGSGMFGNCHLASDHNSDYHFCIKKIHISKYNEDEIKIWSSLDNPNIVKFHGALRRKEKIYIISEFIEGGNLTEAVNQQKRLMRRLGQKTALHIFRQLLHVLLYLEKKSVVHEDIKADNILLRGKSLEIAVADFGTARRMTGKQSSLVGTPTHFSPEKAESSGHGFKSDLWAAVCVLVHMLSGDPPWVKRFSNATTLHFIIATKPPPLEDVPNNIREDVRNLIRDGFSKKPQERPSSKELLQHRAFNLIHDYGGETQYSILPTNLADDDTRLPSHKTNLQTLQILSEVQEDLENPPNERSPGIETLFEGKLDIRDVNITGMLGKSKPEQKSQDLTLQSLPEKTTRFSSLEDSPIYSSIKKSILASPEEIINSVKDPEEYIKSYYSDRFQPGEFFHPENLVITALPVYIQEHGDQYTPNQPIQNEELVPESTNNHSGDLGVLPNLPFFASEGPDNAHDNDSESEFDRLQARALREQLSKTSTTSTGSDGGRISSVLNSSGEEFFQDRIIETLIEEPESSALDDDDDDRLQNTDNHQSFSSEEVFNERDIEIQDKMRSESVTPTGPGNLPNIILDFTSSTSTISNSKSAKSIDIIVTIQTDEEQNDTGDCRTAKVEEEKTIVVQNPIPDLQEINQSLQKKSSSDTMFDYVDRDISEDDLFGDDALKKNSKDHGSFSSSGLESLSQELQPAIANEPLRPFVVKRDPKDPTKAEVVPETDPDKFIEHPITFKKKSPKNLNLNLKREKRKSTPEFPITTPVTPSKYYTPQLNQPLGHLHTPTSGYNTSTPSFNNRPSFPDLRSNRSSSPRQTSSLLDRSEEEIEKYYRELSQHSGDPLSDLDQQDQPEVEFHIENDNDYDQSLSYCLEKYVQSTPNDDKNVKVTIKKLDGESLTAKLTFEYSKGIWKDFVEEWASQIQTNDCKIFTLHNSDGKQIDLQERPLDLHKDYNVTLHMVDASKDFFNQAWYCENGICKMGPGIPVLV